MKDIENLGNSVCFNPNSRHIGCIRDSSFTHTIILACLRGTQYYIAASLFLVNGGKFTRKVPTATFLHFQAHTRIAASQS
jgi:hypothetical protein